MQTLWCSSGERNVQSTVHYPGSSTYVPGAPGGVRQHDEVQASGSLNGNYSRTEFPGRAATCDLHNRSGQPTAHYYQPHHWEETAPTSDSTPPSQHRRAASNYEAAPVGAFRPTTSTVVSGLLPTTSEHNALINQLKRRVVELESQLASSSTLPRANASPPPQPPDRPVSKAAKRRARKKRLEAARDTALPGDQGATRAKGKKKKSSKRQRKKASGRTSKLQRKFNASNSKIQKLRRENAALRQLPPNQPRP